MLICYVWERSLPSSPEGLFSGGGGGECRLDSIECWKPLLLVPNGNSMISVLVKGCVHVLYVI